jgi:hypothetical protein
MNHPEIAIALSRKQNPISLVSFVIGNLNSPIALAKPAIPPSPTTQYTPPQCSPAFYAANKTRK